jgi:hypothetical protein
MIIARKNGSFAVRIYLGRAPDGKQQFDWVGTYPNRELAEEAERVATPPKPRPCIRCRQKFSPANDRRIRCDRCLRHLRAGEPLYDDHWVYYCYDAAGTLLYVGVTSAGIKRFRRHGNERWWWSEVANIALKHFATAREAREHERLEIARLLPPHNRNAPGKPGTR